MLPIQPSPSRKAITAWFQDRLALDSIREFIAHKTVPVHSGTVWYTFGGITLFLFMIQVATGILLLLYYRPTPAEAYESVQFIMTRVAFGWLILEQARTSGMEVSEAIHVPQRRRPHAD